MNNTQLPSAISYLNCLESFRAERGEADVMLLELLLNGWHYAFTDMLGLLQRDSACQISGNIEILRKLQHELTDVEAARRNYESDAEDVVFNKYFQLAQYFDRSDCPEYVWLRDHFVHVLMTIEINNDDSGYKQANALEYFGRVQAKQSNFQHAVAAFTEMHEISHGHPEWKSMRTGGNMALLACQGLIETYLMQINTDKEADKVGLAKMAIKIGLLSKDYELQVQVNSHVNPVFEKNANVEDALEFNRSFFRMCLEKEDSLRLRDICPVLQRLHSRANKNADCVKYLHKFAQIAEMKEDWLSLCVAYQSLAGAYDQCGDHEKALRWNNKANTLPKMFPNLKPELDRINPHAAHFYGIIRANSIFQNFINTVTHGSVISIMKVIDWKKTCQSEEECFDPNKLPDKAHIKIGEIKFDQRFETFFDACIN